MKKIHSPFKFLDAFTLADHTIFFGRNSEIEQIYDLVFKAPLLLIYGASGTGKTSLIQCGLANRFDGTDWLPLWIRRDIDINSSMQLAIEKVLPETEDKKDTLTTEIKQLYQYYLRPVFLIFDQFEELFIFGTKEEQDFFVNHIKTILKEELPCSILLVIREEYLGHLYSIEKEIPELFDFRMRVEAMDNAHVKEVLDNSFEKFNISVEQPREERFDQIIENVSRGKSGIELPYLQVYLDKLYREDFQQTYPKKTETKDNKGNWLPLKLTKAEIQKFGNIDNVLDKFLTEQQIEIQSQLNQQFPKIQKDAVKLVLDAFVSEEGTKRPIHIRREQDTIQLEATVNAFFPNLSNESFNFCIDAMETARLIRIDSNSIELAHDSLADLIDNRRTDEHRKRNDIKRQIRSMYQNFSRTKEYLTQKQIAVFEDVLPDLNLNKELIQFFKDSQSFREKEAEKELVEAQRRTNQFRMFAILTGLGLLVAIGFGLWALQQRGIAQQQTKKAKKALNDVLEAQKAKDLTEFSIIIQNARLILSGGNCPPQNMLQQFTDMKNKYPKDLDLQKDIDDILEQSSNCEN